MSIATSSRCARSGSPGLTRLALPILSVAAAPCRARHLAPATRARRVSSSRTFAVAFSKMPVLSFSGVAASRLHLPPFRRWHRQAFGERAAANSRKRRRVCRIGRLQIIQLPRRRRSEAEPIHHLEPAGFSHQGVCGPAQCAIGADCRRPWHRSGAVERALHGLSFAVPIGRAQPARPRPRIRMKAFPARAATAPPAAGCAGIRERIGLTTPASAAGMRDLRNLYVRANACVACHQNLAPELLKAGHPDLFFELDGQSVAEPKHWRDEEPWSGLRQWLTGQAVALREMSWALANDPQNDAFVLARWDGLAWLCATATSAASIPSPVSQPLEHPRPVGFHQHANAGGRARSPRVGLQLERGLRAIVARRAGGRWTRNSPRRERQTIARAAREASCPRTGSAGKRAQPEPWHASENRARAQSTLPGCKDSRFVRCERLRRSSPNFPRGPGQKRVRTLFQPSSYSSQLSSGSHSVPPFGELETPRRSVPNGSNSRVEPIELLAENARPTMAAPSSTSRPSWQRNPVFRFFASLKLAVVLLAVLIIGAIAGTLYESTFDAKVARAYVYGAPWFNVWLLFLAAEPHRLGLVALALEKASRRVSHHASRHHYAPGRVAHRTHLGH